MQYLTGFCVVVCVLTWVVLRHWDIMASAPPGTSVTIVTFSPIETVPDKIEEPKKRVFTREEGLEKLKELIAKPPNPNHDKCENIKTFLEEFKENKSAWNVDQYDVRTEFLRTRSLWELGKRYKDTISCIGSDFAQKYMV